VLQLQYRNTFPLPPPDMLNALGPDFCPTSMTTYFDTEDGRLNPRLSDPNFTPISIPMYIRAPYFKPDPDNNAPYSTRQENPVSEFDTVASVLEGLFFSICTFQNRGHYSSRPNMHSAVRHEHHSTVLVITPRGRILAIPRSTIIKDILAGARWPRSSSASGVPTFTDLRKAPRPSNNEIDGIELCLGWFMELYVIPQENLEAL
jgi:hypothetical protein